MNLKTIPPLIKLFPNKMVINVPILQMKEKANPIIPPPQVVLHSENSSATQV